ncbi:hypothetical protein [Candidatus Avelusimicrobium faecicola]|uniref:hypothetical protein n=1 Tax=Candidatus Avelusimicrobium faecicola TaxID=3416205 RepID=UPI003D0A9982
MKNIIITGLSLLLVGVSAQAEVIQSVNFNPARFGQYERLKVSEQANFKGGLKAKSMQVQSAGTIDLNATPSTDQGNLAYLITKLDGTLGHSHVGNDFPSTPTLEFPATCFSSLESCVTATATGTLNVKFQKGAARFQAPSSYTTAPESRIKQITTEANRLRLEAVYANINGRLHVSGNEGYTYRNRDLNRNAHTPMRLAGNWIPLPSASGAPTGGTLEWQTRKTVKYGSSGGDKVRVLALKGKKSVSCNKTCHDGNCPSGYTGKITYRLNTTTCSCEVASNTCKPKNEKKEKYEWVSVQSGTVPGYQEIMNPAYCRTTSYISDPPQGYNVDCKTTPCSSGNVGKYCSNVETRQINNYHGHDLYWVCYYHVFRCEKK